MNGLKSQLPVENLHSLKALAEQRPEGAFVELGVYQGGSALVLYHVAQMQNRKLHLFDTFTGIPERSPEIDCLNIGEFSDVDLPDIKKAMPEAFFHIGVFPATLPENLKDIAFVHIDCDQYETCKSAIELLWPRMVLGGVMAFDDWPFPGIQKAFRDYFKTEPSFTDVLIPYAVKT